MGEETEGRNCWSDMFRLSFPGMATCSRTPGSGTPERPMMQLRVCRPDCGGRPLVVIPGWQPEEGKEEVRQTC